jgi:hypothetical protein
MPKANLVNHLGIFTSFGFLLSDGRVSSALGGVESRGGQKGIKKISALPLSFGVFAKWSSTNFVTFAFSSFSSRW